MKIRISTLLLLVVIAALAIALVVERRRYDRDMGEAVELFRRKAVFADEPSPDLREPHWFKRR